MIRNAHPMPNLYTSKILILYIIAVVLFGNLATSFSAGAYTYRGTVSPNPQTEAVPTKPVTAPAVPEKKVTITPEKKATAAPASRTTKKSSATQSAPKKNESKKKAAPVTKKSTPPKKTTRQANTKKAPAKTVKPAQPSLQKKQTQPTKKNAPTAKPKSTKASSSNKDLHLNVKAALLVNMSTGKVYYEQNPDKPIAPASITKVLTLYLLRESLAQGKLSWATPIPISARAVAAGGSSMHLNKGEKVPLADLVKGISVVSANNACVAVAEYLGKGDPNAFVRQMNAKAKKIGMNKSLFKTPNGLPAPGQLSTARDLAKLSMSYLRTFPESLSIHSMTAHSYNGVAHRNANSLLRTYPGVDGLKTGFVCSSGYNITATAKRGQTRLIAVVLGAQNAMIRQIETARLLDYGFKQAAIAGDHQKASRTSSPKKVKK